MHNNCEFEGEPESNDKPVGQYPTIVTRNQGDTCLVVQAFWSGKYIGLMEVEFDNAGRVVGWNGAPILLDNSVEQGTVFKESSVKYM